MREIAASLNTRIRSKKRENPLKIGSMRARKKLKRLSPSELLFSLPLRRKEQTGYQKKINLDEKSQSLMNTTSHFRQIKKVLRRRLTNLDKI